MKRNYSNYTLLVFFIFTLAFVSCTKSPEEKLKEALKDVVIEKGSGLITDYKFISLQIDTVRVKDIKAFINKSFPEKDFPNGVPSDFEDEDFDIFIAPLKENSNDEDICYLSVKHKYSFFNPFFNKNTEKVVYRLFEELDGQYKYVADDLRKDYTWMKPTDYKLDKTFEELDNVMNNTNF